jgi:hypothetical protein
MKKQKHRGTVGTYHMVAKHNTINNNTVPGTVCLQYIHHVLYGWNLATIVDFFSYKIFFKLTSSLWSYRDSHTRLVRMKVSWFFRITYCTK